MMSNNCKPWEIWYAKVKFDDDPSIVKNRPVVILEDKKAYLLSLKVTSAPPRNNYYGEYQLIKWQESGLKKPSTVRISKKLKLYDNDMCYKIGRLHPVDIMKIRILLIKEK